MSETANRERLRSWKAIATYLKCSVRSARRWESEEGLPVHRHMHKSQGTVYAYRDELDAWQRRGESATPPVPSRGESPERSIAVLPFSYVGPDSANEYIADGFTEEVIADLSKIRALKVISRTSSMALKNTAEDARSIARTLRVRYLLEGTVRQQDRSLRVSARLIDPETDDRFWASKYDGTIDEVFAIQERIARDVADALQLKLTAGDDRRLQEHAVEDVAAWRYALQARQAALRWRPDAIEQAIALLDKAIDSAGEIPVLLAALGRAWLHYREAGIDAGDEPVRQAERCAARIAAVDPDTAAGLQLAGWIHYTRGDLKDAVSRLNLALRQDPNDPDTLGLLANCYLVSGRVALARPLIDHLLAVDPLTPLTRCLPGWANALEGDFAGAVDAYRDMYEMDPGNPLARLFLIWILASAGRNDEALDLAERFPQHGSLPHHVAGLFATALSVSASPLPEFPQELGSFAATGEMFPRLLGQAYAMNGSAKHAVDWLSLAVERGFINYPFLAEHDPLLANVRDTAEFRELLSRVRDRWETFEEPEAS